MNAFGTRPRRPASEAVDRPLGKAAPERDTKTARTGGMKSYEQCCRRPPHRRRISMNSLVGVVSAPSRLHPEVLAENEQINGNTVPPSAVTNHVSRNALKPLEFRPKSPRKACLHKLPSCNQLGHESVGRAGTQAATIVLRPFGL